MVTSVEEVFSYVSQGVFYGLDVAKKMHGNVNVFQKTAQIGAAVITLLKPHTYQKDRGYTLLWSASEVINSTRILQDFGNWCFPISADKIDEEAVVKSFFDFYAAKKKENEKLCDETQALVSIRAGVAEQLKMKKPLQNPATLRNYIAARLNKREEFKDIIDFKEVQIPKEKENSEIPKENSEIPIQISWFYKTSPYSELANVVWVIVNIGSTVNNLIQANIIPKAKLTAITASLGKNRIYNHAFIWVKNVSLDQCLVGLVFTGVLLSLVDAVTSLKNDTLKKTKVTLKENNLNTEKVDDEKAIKQAKWNRITYAADLLFYGTLFTHLSKPFKHGETIVASLCILSRGIGVISVYKNL